MTEFVCGLIGLLLGAAVFALGIVSARGTEHAQTPPAAPNAE